MFVADGDDFCTPETAQETAETIGEDLVTLITIEDATHTTFWNLNTDEFFDQLVAQL